MSSIYKTYTQDQLTELNSNFLIDGWSYSAVRAFGRNQAAFEMVYVARCRIKSSAAQVAGNAYHYALEHHFKQLQVGINQDLVQAEILAYSFIDEVPANSWKLQKTTPTVEDAVALANKNVTLLLHHFYSELGIYEDDIEEVLFVEDYIVEYLTINGVDIPLPCRMKIDLGVRLKDGRNIIIDHKSKTAYTDEKEAEFMLTNQAVVYYKGVESKYGIKVDEMWFVENKISKNKDGSPQLQVIPIVLNEDNIKFYEYKLYESLSSMILAVSDPYHNYPINYDDNFIDVAELENFKNKQMLGEIPDFEFDESKRALVEKRTKRIKDLAVEKISVNTIKAFKANAAKFIQYDISSADMTNEQKIEHALRQKQVMVEVAHTFDGYSSDTYLLSVAAGSNFKSINSNKLSIASALNVPNIRIPENLTIHEGKAYLAIEAPKKREKDLFWDAKELVGMKIPVGKDNIGETLVWDLENEASANCFEAGSAGSGKSQSLISKLEYALLIPEITQFIIFDIKRDFEHYNDLSKVNVYHDIEDIENAMFELVEDMNDKIKRRVKEYVYVIIDEYNEILNTMSKGKDLDIYEDVQIGFYHQTKAMIESGMPPQPKMQRQKVGQKLSFEENLMRLSQKGRSSGFRINAATQLASAEIIPSKIKVNYPVRISYRVPQKENSKVILDESGAELLAGYGDGLIKSPDYPETVRFQSFYKA